MNQSSDLPHSGPETPGETETDTVTRDAGEPVDDSPAYRADLPPSQRGVRRRGLVPIWAVPVAVAVIAVAVTALVLLPMEVFGKPVSVPAVIGLPAVTAEQRLEGAGLLMTRAGTRFSSRYPAGAVIEQRPVAGARVGRGEIVEVIVSAGSETFAMPDLVGLQLQEAKGRLTDRGVGFTVDVVPSDQSSGTVIATLPAPGATVGTSDIVRLTVAASSSASSALLPYPLDGMSFLIDPSPVETGTVDVPMEVTRRLRSLLEASGANVTVTRSVSSTIPTEQDRLALAREAPSTALLGLSFTEEGAGLGVAFPSPDARRSRLHVPTRDFAQRIATELRGSGDVVMVTEEDVPILRAAPVPAVRVRLGSLDDPKDSSAFRDPRWSDEVARALYRAIGEVFGAE